MLTVNVSTVKKSVLPNITITVNVLPENGIVFVWIG